MTLFADLAETSADPNPSDVMYDDVTRAWRNGDYPLAWHLADVLLQYDANGGEPLTGFRHLYYVHAVHDYYAPDRSGRPEELRTP